MKDLIHCKKLDATFSLLNLPFDLVMCIETKLTTDGNIHVKKICIIFLMGF